MSTCFESKKFLPKSLPELSNLVLSFLAYQICFENNLLVVSKACAAINFNILISDGHDTNEKHAKIAKNTTQIRVLLQNSKKMKMELV